MTDTVPMLRGPDPERFRTTYYGARWYRDPLPEDDVWAYTSEKWPSVTTIKKAWSKPFRKKLPTGDTVPLDAYWAAEFMVDNLPAVTALADDRDAAMALICGAGSRTLHQAGRRGTEVHLILETLADGGDPDPLLLDEAARPYLGACRQFIHDWQPRWVASEFVVINRTLGYGGTADAVIAIDLYNQPWLAITDWKSRGGQHGCYEEEVAQIGGYSLAEYMIVTDPDTGTVGRVPLPELNGGLVVSLTTDGYEATPIDLEPAQEAFAAMHASWTEHREGQKRARAARGQPLFPQQIPAISPAVQMADVADTTQPLRVVSATPNPQQLAWLRARVKRIIDQGHLDVLAREWAKHLDVPTYRQGGPQTAEHVTKLAAICVETEKQTGMQFGPPDPTLPPPTKAKARAKA